MEGPLQLLAVSAVSGSLPGILPPLPAVEEQRSAPRKAKNSPGLSPRVPDTSPPGAPAAPRNA